MHPDGDGPSDARDADDQEQSVRDGGVEGSASVFVERVGADPDGEKEGQRYPADAVEVHHWRGRRTQNDVAHEPGGVGQM